jgi:biopolymer transport protein ExbB
MLKTLIDGGPLMIILMAESVLAVAVALDRWMAFRANSRVDVRTLRAKVQNQMLAGKYPDALAICLTTPGPVSAVMAAGLQSYIRHRVVTSNGETLRAIMQDAMADYARMAMSVVEKRMNILSFIGTSAPLFGMTGTVTGMIRSFGAIAAAGDVDAAIVASGISEALITTAAGLLIAMMAVIPHHYFMGCSEAIEIGAAEAGSEILDHVSLTHHVAPAQA